MSADNVEVRHHPRDVMSGCLRSKGDRRDREKSVPMARPIARRGKQSEPDPGGSLEKAGRRRPSRLGLGSPGCVPAGSDPFLPHAERDVEPIDRGLRERFFRGLLIESIENVRDTRRAVAKPGIDITARLLAYRAEPAGQDQSFLRPLRSRRDLTGEVQRGGDSKIAVAPGKASTGESGLLRDRGREGQPLRPGSTLG